MHSTVNNIDFEVFGKHYICAALQPGVMFAVAEEEDGCCWNVLTAFASGKLLSQTVAADSVQKFVCWNAALNVVGDDAFHIQRPHAAWIATIDNVVVNVPQFDPYEIPGTDKNSKYRVLVKTNRGLVSRRRSNLTDVGARLRVASLNEGFDVPKINKIIDPDKSFTWDVGSSSHFAHNFHGAEQLRVGVASGLLELMRLEKVGG